MVQKSLLLTKRELEVIDKKIKNKKLTQQDSNYLSKFVRPKLREMSLINSRELLSKLEYNQRIPYIKKKIKNVVLSSLKGVSSITLFGSVVYNNYQDYNDIDVLVIVKKKFWKKIGEKYKKIIEIKKRAGLNLDIQIYDEETLRNSSSVDLVYQLSDTDTIYGELELRKRIEISKLNLRMKLDYSVLDDDASSKDIYLAIRNVWMVRLLIGGIVDNSVLIDRIINEIGINLVNRLKKGASKVDRKIAMIYLNSLLNRTLKEIDKEKWERIRL